MKKAFPVYDICSLADHQHNDLLISRFAPYLQKHQNLSLPHKHTFYHVVLFTKGAGKHSIDFKYFDVKPYQIYFMVPGQVHRWDFEGEVDGYIINFSAELFQSFLLRPDYLESFAFFTGDVDDEVINLSEGTGKAVTELFKQLLNEADTPNRLNMDMVRALMLQLFIMVARESAEGVTGSGPNYNYTLLQSFRKLVEKNFTILRLPKDYAALLYITPNHLNALCNDMLGISAGELIRNRVVLEAKRLLINHDMNINEIAGKLNFADNSYFTKFFKKYSGITPEDFRKNPVAQ
ncbi:MAG: helix-turn-helix domain-containing protein [Mucilaginibacter sp.]|nr:helix-turn-helix domain-containing protein [Mucilaginibacter sp.]